MDRTYLPLPVGVMIGITGSVFAGCLIYFLSYFPGILVRFVICLISIGCLIFFPHCLTHFVIGTLLGIRFKNYSLGRTSIAKLHLPIVSEVASKLPVLSLKIEQESLASVNHAARSTMFASGALSSMLLPFIVVVGSLNQIPFSLSIVLLMFCLGNLIFDLYYSPKAGDISRIRKS